jgi:Ankyrin repeats (3 copies)
MQISKIAKFCPKYRLMYKKLILLAQLLVHPSIEGMEKAHFLQHMKTCNDKTTWLSVLPQDVVNSLILCYLLESVEYDPEETPLHFALNENLSSLALCLITAGADIHKANIHGNTALHCAAAQGDAAMVEKLIAAGSNLKKTNNSGETAFYVAASAEHYALVIRLFEVSKMQVCMDHKK